jgi:hypothetical protein
MSPKEPPDLNPIAPVFDSISPEPLQLSQTGSTGSAPPQFETAEYADKPGIEKCSQCNQQIMGSYYRLNNRRVCPACAELAKASRLNTEGNFFRGLIFGIGAAILGLIVYSAFEIATGWIIGYLSLAVGYIIAKAMMKGSGGLGGRRFQIAAALLTYAAVSLSAVPVAIHQIATKGINGDKQAQTQTLTPTGGESQNSDTQAAVVSNQSERDKSAGLFSALGFLLLLGLASPFLELASGVSGIIGLVILFVGINIAWKTTGAAQIQILGPFGVEARASR